MVEANPVKFYVAKYFFLVLAVAQWIVGSVILMRYGFTDKTYLGALLFFATGVILIFVFSIVNNKMRRVAIGKNKIVILEGDRNLRFEWPQIKSLKIVPFINIYKLKVKGKKSSIYFFPSDGIDPAFGLLARKGSVNR